MALSIRDLVNSARFLFIPGTEYPGPLLSREGRKALLRPGWQVGTGPARRNRFAQVLFGDSGLQATGTDGLTNSAANRMRDYSQYLNSYTIPTVWKALNEIISTVCASELRILDDRDQEVDVEHEFPDLHKLLVTPNEEVDGYTFDALLTMDDQLTGNTITALDEQNGVDQPASIYRLRPDKVSIMRAPTGDLVYLYNAKPGWGEDPVPYFPSEIVHGKWPHPTNPLWGLGVIEAGEVSFSADRRINEFKYSYFDRGGVLEGVLYHDGNLSDEEYDRLLTRWRALRSGGRMQMRTAILTDGAKYEPIQEPIGNVPIVALAKMSRNDILELFGVPPQCLGDFEGTNYRNAQEAKAYFYSDTITPILVRREKVYTPIAKRFDERLKAVYIRREILDYQLRAQTAVYLSQTASFTRNDIRVAAGFEPFAEDDPIGKVIVNAGRGQSELFPTDYDEPNDLLPITGNATEPPPAGRAATRLTPAQIAAQQQLNAIQTDTQQGTKGFPIARSQPAYPAGLVSHGYKAAQRQRQQAAWAAKAQAVREHRTIVTEEPATQPDKSTEE